MTYPYEMTTPELIDALLDQETDLTNEAAERLQVALDEMGRMRQELIQLRAELGIEPEEDD